MSERPPIWIILFTILIDSLGIGILVPIVPQLLGNPHSPQYLLPRGSAPGAGYILLGCLIAVFPVMQFFATPVLGQLSDRHGRKRILAVSLAGTALGYMLFAVGIIVRSIPLLFVARAIDGITGGNISVAQAAIADVTTPQERTKTFGLIGGVFGVGFILGPFLGGILGNPAMVSWFNAATPFWFAAMLAAFNTVSLMVQFRETNRHIRHVPLELVKGLNNIARAYARPALRPIFLTMFFFNAGFGFFVAFFGVFLIDRFGYSQTQIGNFFAYVGVFMIFTQAVTTRWAAGRFTETQVLRISLLGVAAVMGSYVLAPSAHWIFLIGPLSATFNGLSMANLGGLLSRSVAPNVQGEVLGIGSSIQALAQALPPLAAGVIAASFTSTAPVLAAACTMLLAWASFALLYRPVAPTRTEQLP